MKKSLLMLILSAVLLLMTSCLSIGGDPEKQLQEANNLMEQEKYSDALDIYEDLISANGSNIDARKGYAEAAYELGDMELTSRAIRDALAIDPLLDITWNLVSQVDVSPVPPSDSPDVSDSADSSSHSDTATSTPATSENTSSNKETSSNEETNSSETTDNDTDEQTMGRDSCIGRYDLSGSGGGFYNSQNQLIEAFDLSKWNSQNAQGFALLPDGRATAYTEIGTFAFGTWIYDGEIIVTFLNGDTMTYWNNMIPGLLVRRIDIQSNPTIHDYYVRNYDFTGIDTGSIFMEGLVKSPLTDKDYPVD